MLKIYANLTLLILIISIKIRCIKFKAHWTAIQVICTMLNTILYNFVLYKITIQKYHISIKYLTKILLCENIVKDKVICKLVIWWDIKWLVSFSFNLNSILQLHNVIQQLLYIREDLKHTQIYSSNPRFQSITSHHWDLYNGSPSFNVCFLYSTYYGKLTIWYYIKQY